MAHDAPSLTQTVLSEVVHKLKVDERTVLRRLLRLPVRGRVAERIDLELEARGLIAPEGTRRAA